PEELPVEAAAEEPAKEPAKAKPAAAVRKVLKKKAPVVVEEEPEAEEPVVAEAAEPVEVESPAEQVDEAPAKPVEEEEKPAEKPSGTQIKKLTLTSAALKKGVKPGERLVSDQPTKTGKLSDEARGRDARGRRTEFRGTPGETATPQMNYTPPADNRR